MLGDASRRRLGAAAEGRRNIEVLADGTEPARQMAAQMLKARVKNCQIQYS